MFIGLILLIALLALLYFLYQKGDLDFLKGNENPGEILDRRYAAGEITEEEYKIMKRTLNV
jgi:uncharacterized membrane protein